MSHPFEYTMLGGDGSLEWKTFFPWRERKESGLVLAERTSPLSEVVLAACLQEEHRPEGIPRSHLLAHGGPRLAPKQQDLGFTS